VESGRVCLPESAPWLADFLEELTSFPAAPHDDMVDALTQALNWMRGSGFDYEGLRSIGGLQERYLAQRHREAPPMINHVADADALEYDANNSGVRYTNAGRFSRLRGGW
jgi:hypothetical protein